MNTPAHALLNLLILARRGKSSDQKDNQAAPVVPVVAGSILPDAPMFVFYGWERLAGTPEAVIWRSRYYDPNWQAFFDLFNSLPIIVVTAVIARVCGWRWVFWLALAMALHVLCDLPLHHDDAHRHFFPFSDWRFASPVSYWDPAHYGRISSLMEVGMCGFAVAWLWHRYRAYEQAGARIMVCLLGATYFAHWTFVFMVWA